MLVRSNSRTSGRISEDSVSRHAGRPLADDRRRGLLVGAARVGVEERDRDRLDALAREEIDGRASTLAGSSGVRTSPARPEPLGDLAPPAPRHERRRALEVDVVEPRQPEPPDLEEVAEPRRREEPRPRAAALEDRVRGHGRAVDQLADVGRADAGRRHQLARALDDRLGVVAGGGEHLPRERPPVRPDQDQVGERAADVDAQAMSSSGLSGPADLEVAPAPSAIVNRLGLDATPALSSDSRLEAGGRAAAPAGAERSLGHRGIRWYTRHRNAPAPLALAEATVEPVTESAGEGVS